MLTHTYSWCGVVRLRRYCYKFDYEWTRLLFQLQAQQHQQFVSKALLVTKHSLGRKAVPSRFDFQTVQQLQRPRRQNQLQHQQEEQQQQQQQQRIRNRIPQTSLIFPIVRQQQQQQQEKLMEQNIFCRMLTTSSLELQQHHHHQHRDDDNNRQNTKNDNQQQQQQQQQQQRGLLRLLQQEERDILKEQRMLHSKARQIAQRLGGGGDTSTTSTTPSTTSTFGQGYNNYLDDMGTFSVVVAGEYNSGKSTLINALLGTKLLETGSIPTTDSITILSSSKHQSSSIPKTTANDWNYHDENNIESISDNGTSSNFTGNNPVVNNKNNTVRNISPGLIHYIVDDLPLLDDLTIVDTPGTNAVITDHTATTIRLLPSADLILFVTSADRPFPESERVLLETIATQYRKSVVVIINKMDILEQTGGSHGQHEKEKVINFVTEHASTMLGARPVVLAVSARDALSAKIILSQQQQRQQQQNLPQPLQATTTATKSIVWERSNFRELERYLTDTLTTETKIRSKLSSPLGTVEAIIYECKQRLDKKIQELENDISTMNLLQNQFLVWQNELKIDIEYYTSVINKQLQNQSNRCYMLRRRMNPIEYWFSVLFNIQRLKQEWNKTKSIVIRSGTSSSSSSSTLLDSTSQRDVLLGMVPEIADSIATRGRAQGQTVIEFLGKRPMTSSSLFSSSSSSSSLVGTVTAASRFEETRQNLIHYLSDALHKNIDIDEEGEGEDTMMLQKLQYSAWFACTSTVGSVLCAALSIHSLLYTSSTVILLLPGQVTTTTMLLPALSSILGMSGMYALAFGQDFVAKQYSDRWDLRRNNLNDDLNRIFTNEVLVRVNRKVQDGITPYTTYVTVERDRIEQFVKECDSILTATKLLRKRISSLRISSLPLRK